MYDKGYAIYYDRTQNLGNCVSTIGATTTACRYVIFTTPDCSNFTLGSVSTSATFQPPQSPVNYNPNFPGFPNSTFQLVSTNCATLTTLAPYYQVSTTDTNLTISAWLLAIIFASVIVLFLRKFILWGRK